MVNFDFSSLFSNSNKTEKAFSLKDRFLVQNIEFFLILGTLFRFKYAHGLRTPNEAFSHQNLNILDLKRPFGVFLADFSATILVL